MPTRRPALSALLAVSGFVAALGWYETRALSQESDGASRLRGLNGQVLQLYGQLSEAGPGNGAALQRGAEAVLEARLATLATLIELDPAEALRLAFSSDVLSDLAGAFPSARRYLERRDVWEGPIEYLIEDGPEFRSHRTIRSMAVGGETLVISFAGAEPAGLLNGDTLRVEGIRAGDHVAAETGTIVRTSGANTRAAKPAPPVCSTFGVQSTIVLLVTMPGAAVPPEITEPALRDIFFDDSGTVSSLTDYWREASYGLTTASGDIAPGTSNGWYTLDQVYNEDQASQIRSAAIAAADADVDFTQYRRIFIVMNGATDTSATWSGLGTIGCGSLSSRDGTFNASTSWLKSTSMVTHARGVHLAAHEGGHNLGLGHSQSREFDTEALGAPGVGGVVDEYNDVFANMGRGFGHYAAPHKFQLGWMSTQVQTVTGSGSYFVQPTEVARGTVQALRIRRGSTMPTGSGSSSVSQSAFMTACSSVPSSGATRSRISMTG